VGEIVFLVRDLVIKAGGLLFWPAFRRLDAANQRRNKALRLIFVCHLLADAALLIWLYGALIVFDIQAPQLIRHFNSIGEVSIVAALITLYFTRVKSP